MDILKESIIQGIALAVCNGSYLESQQAGTASWIIEDGNQLQQLGGSLESPGSPLSQCSHCSELAGILGTVTHLNKLCVQHQVERGSVTVGCDGIGAIQSICNDFRHTSAHKHYDIINSIKTSISQSPLHWTFMHIKGHQDDFTHFDHLSRPVQLNTIVDSIAKHSLSTMLQYQHWNRYYPQHLPYEGIEVYWIDSQHMQVKVNSCLRKTLTTHIQTSRIRNYWIKKGKFSPITSKLIDWEASKKSRSSFARNKQQWLSKWMTGFCGVGVMLQWYKHQQHSKCPRCLTDNEDTTHVCAAHLMMLALYGHSQWIHLNAG
jgi:hypothetical protein